MNVDVLAQLLSKREQLHSDLVPYLRESPLEGRQMIHHPILIDVVVEPERYAFINEQYRHKKAAIEQALEERNYKSYIFLHERPYRFDAFCRCIRLKGFDYWPTLKSAWIDSENIHENREEWLKLWRSRRPNKETVMSEAERKCLADMPDEIKVYRGINYDRDKKGLSWTIDPNIAKRFSLRFARHRSDPRVIEGVVNKKHVHAFFLDRNESEIVSNKVRITVE